MKIFYDTEFIEDGRTIDLISIGMVAEDGRELYLVNEGIGDDPLYERIRGHYWLMENVVPHLPLAPRWDGQPSIGQPSGPRVHPHTLGHFHLDLTDNRIVPLRFIGNAVRDFVLAAPDPELWAWYGAYDHVVLCWLWGRMVDLPEGVPMWTNDLRQEVHRLGVNRDSLPTQADGVHNALADARHVRDLYDRVLAGSESDG